MCNNESDRNFIKATTFNFCFDKDLLNNSFNETNITEEFKINNDPTLPNKPNSHKALKKTKQDTMDMIDLLVDSEDQSAICNQQSEIRNQQSSIGNKQSTICFNKIENLSYQYLLNPEVTFNSSKELHWDELKVEKDLWNLYKEVEFPLVPISLEMEAVDMHIEETKKERRIINFISKKQRGKPRTKDNGKYHSGNAPDNIKTKIQVHYLNFIVTFFNDIINALLGIKDYFNKFAYSEKSKISSGYFEEMKHLTIGDIFEKLRSSNKYRRNISSKAKKEKVLFLQKYDSIKRLLDMNYLTLFAIYYNNNQPLKDYLINGKRIILSKGTKSFQYLILKYKQFENDFNLAIKMDYLTI